MRQQLRKILLSPSWRNRLPVMLLLIGLTALMCLPALAGKPTISGILKNYNPGGLRLQIQRADGKIKTVKLRPNTIYMLYGKPSSCRAFRQGMQVAVRICGSLMDDPLEGDLISDIVSSNQVVSRKASSPNPTPVGSFASVSGASGVVGALPGNQVTPSVMGPLGLGGNFAGSLTNPGQNGPINNSAFPDPNGLNANGAEPAMNNQPITPPGQNQLPGGLMPGGTQAPLNPNQQYINNNPYGSQNPYAQNTPYDPSNPAGVPSTASLINTNDDDDEDDSPSFIPAQSGGPMGMQTVSFQGRVFTVDALNRVLSIVPDGTNQPTQVVIPAQVNPINQTNGQTLPLKAIQPGMGAIVQGLSNTAGIIEARQIYITR